ncbi:30S ribosomal protein S5 alanine N-acetyltransferase [Aestuariivirga litoralis]|uniref:30S ribosomal protein S5 alanine N-acetyltransferase n=1 Tax=Aestuariivirga litoralis TaxID=2650924 RepID=A0A2W2ATC4_9HYPH|nr:GNAT family protein [Aestuariivirga litoralis]PZF75790.1 30S ribosomal protein S5 alanine N-acetyltransferase [Aestuariivirga litoralis]
MAFLRSPFAGDPPPSLRDGRALIRVPDMGDYDQWSTLRAESRHFLTPWEPVWPANDLTRTAFRSRIRQYWRDIDEDLAYPYFIFTEDGETLVGALTLSNVRRGVAQTGTLGYWIGEPHARKGYMTSAVRLMCDFAFRHLGLHRVEAACLPQNTPSIGLLRKTGFAQEGLARGYLKIAGEWRDHLLFARLSD